jgi:hypothetical protein
MPIGDSQHAERRIRRVGYADGFVAERDGIGIG